MVNLYTIICLPRLVRWQLQWFSIANSFTRVTPPTSKPPMKAGLWNLCYMYISVFSEEVAASMGTTKILKTETDFVLFSMLNYFSVFAETLENSASFGFNELK